MAPGQSLRFPGLLEAGRAGWPTRPGKLTAILLCCAIVFNGLFISQLLLFGNRSTSASNAAPLPENTTGSGSQFDYIVVILMENNNLCDVLTTCGGSGTYMTQLASNFSLAKQYTAIDHPSLPNYLAITGGNAFGCSGYDGGPNSNACTSTAWSSSNIVDRVEATGLTWRSYMEDMPSNCYGSDSGNYAVRHDPFVYYSDIVNNQTRCNRVVPATAPLDPELVNDLKSKSTASNFMWLTPNLCNDMHDCSVSTGSAYLATLVPLILASFIFTTQKAALFITFDEGNGNHPSDYVYTVWLGSTVKKAYSSSVQYNHYSFLKTLETVWGLQALSLNDASANPMTEFMADSTRGALRAGFTRNPTSPQMGQSVTFNETDTGGTPPYSSNWNFGDGTNSTGNTVTHAFSTKGAFTVTLSARDSGVQTSNSSETITVSNPQSPIIIGWGGTRLDESVKYDLANPFSQVFSGEQASDQELQVQKLASSGYNAFRVSFQSQCTNWQEMGRYDPSYLSRSITIANHYNVWIIVDYHGFIDLKNSTSVSCWLSFWKPLVEQFENNYAKIIWEPINEPTGLRGNVSYLSQQYQSWINQDRALGDTHWIVVQNLCSYGCVLGNWADGFPTVTDAVGKVFISLHSYMGYNDYSSWNNATADAVAQRYYQSLLSGSSQTGWPVLNTEGGTDPLVTTCGGSSPTGCPTDDVLAGSAGYSITTLHFIQALTKLYDSNSPQRINWIWWTMGSWTSTPGAGIFGALSSTGWANLLLYQRILLNGDVNGDGGVDMKDLLLVVEAFGNVQGEAGYNPSADIDHDGCVTITDLVIVADSIGVSLSIVRALQSPLFLLVNQLDPPLNRPGS